MKAVDDILQALSPISLEDMSGIRLMNRTDTKYVMDRARLAALLEMAADDYSVQESEGQRQAPYRTVYLDTPAMQMFQAHECGRRVREKIRVRTYEATETTFLEVKNKNNRGRTDKKRILVSSIGHMAEEGATDFLRRHAWYDLDDLVPRLETRFRRITLVNHKRTERLTIDCELAFHNINNDHELALPGLVIVELKRDGLTPSPAKEMLRKLHVHPAGFSKYCMGCALTDPGLRQNRIKPRLHRVLALNGASV